MQRYVSKICLFVCLLLAVIVFCSSKGHASDNKATAKNKIKQSVQVKLPDGLYLFEGIKTGGFRPLFIVEKAKLSDPYVVIKKMGIKKFNQKYSKGKLFNVSVSNNIVGELRNFNIEKEKTQECETDDFLPYFKGDGDHVGTLLMNKEIVESTYLISDWAANYVSSRAIVSPEAWCSVQTRKTHRFTLMKDDITNIGKTASKTFSQELIEIAKKELKMSEPNKKIKEIQEDENKVLFALAVDIDNNGKKDIVGVIDVGLKYLYTEPPRSSNALKWHKEVLFVLWDSGKIEKIALSTRSKFPPELGIIGVMDVDMDGLQELIIQRETGYLGGEPFIEEGKIIEVLRYRNLEWEVIFKTKKICATIR